jgi:hypothetical protein
MHSREITGVLHNFLGTYTSRYSDYEGYWMFGWLVGEIEELRIDLLSLNEGSTEKTPIETAKLIAAQKFKEQVEKVGGTLDCIREAYLDLKKLPGIENGMVNGRVCAGNTIRFEARAVSDHGKAYESEMTLFVASHNPQVELRSNRALPIKAKTSH